MARATIGGKELILAPFKFEQLELAGPSIDRLIQISKTWKTDAESLSHRTVADITAATAPLLHVVAVGVWTTNRNEAEAAGVKYATETREIEAEIDVIFRDIKRSVSMPEINGLQATFGQIMLEAGMTGSGERSGAPVEARSPSETKSEE